MDGVRNRTVAFPKSAGTGTSFSREPQGERWNSHARDSAVRTTHNWRRSLATSLWAGLLVLVAVLYSRKFAGAFQAPDSAVGACLVAVIALGPALLAWTLCRAVGHHRPTGAFRAVLAGLTVVPPFALGAALLPDGLSFGIWFLPALCGITFLSLLTFEGGRKPVSGRQSQSFGARRPVVQAALAKNGKQTRHPTIECIREFKLRGVAGPKALRGPDSASELGHGVPARRDGPATPLADNSRTPSTVGNESHTDVTLVWTKPVRGNDDAVEEYSQQLIRSFSAERGDVLEGSVKVSFAAGQRQANVHIPFIPPFVNVPAVECEALEGCDVRLKVGTVQTFGTRIEAKRTEAIDQAHVAEIAFAAVLAQQQSNAA
jgi:hypothetical protein